MFQDCATELSLSWPKNWAKKARKYSHSTVYVQQMSEIWTCLKSKQKCQTFHKNVLICITSLDFKNISTKHASENWSFVKITDNVWNLNCLETDWLKFIQFWISDTCCTTLLWPVQSKHCTQKKFNLKKVFQHNYVFVALWVKAKRLNWKECGQTNELKNNTTVNDWNPN